MKYILLLITGLFLQTSLQAQDRRPVPASKAHPHEQPNVVGKEKEHPDMVCPKCGYTSKAETTCPKDKSDMLKTGTYYCKNDEGIISTKPGKCKICKKDLAMIKPGLEKNK